MFKFLFLFCMLIAFSAIAADKVRYGEPTFLEIMSVVLERENLNWSAASQWKKQMKRAPWLPTLSLGYDHSLRKDSSLSITDNISVTSQAIAVGPPDNDWDESLNRAQVLKVRALWSLEDLIFHSSTFQRSAELREIARSRQIFTEQVFKVYQERAKLMALSGYSSRNKTEIRTLTEKLDFYTQGRFHHRWRQYP